ncbi:MAG TPA: hypothetical protein VIV40_06810 [Kofleriaceae bacterium]
MVHVVLALLVSTSIARGGGVVLESYTGERPADAPRLLAPVLEELSRRDYDAGDAVARSYEAQASRPAVTPAGLPSDFAAQADRGFKSWIAGRFEEATRILVPLVESAQANSGAFARDPSLRDPMLKALIALALAYQRIGDLGAMRSTFGEVLRSFPDAQVSRAVYGPDAAQAFDQVRRDTQALGRGKLIIKVDDAAVVFVDEMYRAVGPTTLDLAPGEYRVVVMMNKQPSRSHHVTVRANAETTVEIDAKLDQALRTAGFTGMTFVNESDRDTHEAQFAQRFAKTVGASAVAVVGIDSVRGRLAVVGTLVSLQTGREIRRASIPVEPDPSRDRLRALARFLAGDDPAPGLEVQFSGSEQDPPNDDHHDRVEAPRGDGGPWGGWRFVTAGLGVAGLATGVVLVALDGKCPSTPPMGQQCNDFYDTATPGYLALAGGAVFTGLSIYLFATHHSAPVVTPTSGGATVGFATRW